MTIDLEKRTEPSPARKAVWLIDDDATMRALYETVLDDLGCEVLTFSGGEEALCRLQSLPRPELIFVDFQLNKMTGERFVSELRATCPDLGAHTKIVGLSGHSNGSPIVARFKDLVDFYSEKPPDLGGLVQLLDKFTAA